MTLYGKTVILFQMIGIMLRFSISQGIFLLRCLRGLQIRAIVSWLKCAGNEAIVFGTDADEIASCLAMTVRAGSTGHCEEVRRSNLSLAMTVPVMRLFRASQRQSIANHSTNRTNPANQD